LIGVAVDRLDKAISTWSHRFRRAVTWAIQTARDTSVVPAAVFRLYADPSTWSAWGHNAKWARANGPLVEGGTVDVRANYGKVYQCRIRRLVPDRALVLEVRTPLFSVTQTYAVDERADGARVQHALELSGRLSGILRLCGAPWLYQRLLDREVEKVIALAGAGARPGTGQSGSDDRPTPP
jgi:uncharacterized protein YndB with AHSA1/START domain